LQHGSTARAHSSEITLCAGRATIRSHLNLRELAAKMLAPFRKQRRATVATKRTTRSVKPVKKVKSLPLKAVSAKKAKRVKGGMADKHKDWIEL
jgi:hypothetical protein